MSSHNYSTQRDMHDDNKENKELKLYFSLLQAVWESNPMEIWKSHK